MVSKAYVQGVWVLQAQTAEQEEAGTVGRPSCRPGDHNLMSSLGQAVHATPVPSPLPSLLPAHSLTGVLPSSLPAP